MFEEKIELPEQKTEFPYSSPMYLYIPVGRLIFLSIFSFHLYEAYWIYKNWQYLKKRKGLNIRPFWRGVFGVLFCHSLFRMIYNDEEAIAIKQPTFSPKKQGNYFVTLSIGSGLINRAKNFWAGVLMPFVPSYLAFVPVQKYINEITEKRNPTQQYYKWSWGHILCIIYGTLFWGLILPAIFLKLKMMF
ncbi:hypothetical protein TTHT_1823 [Thermotomaculum hydrothermale]|uniref:Uncharacterized protein n=1 Tax=Thermotomaculum hydrothermale TaxID=981385 RepID=A0A7R6PS10_9BACT|nr:hypothetical protein [Thermotomaculum hydrothermale]BBB33281.1 hypothetical protein TTHT_1823 [Thermotomaculum hydrothermale]